ncbi:MAG: hypothetical protein AB7E67_17870, partial [Xanthobacteraceae bacterium]
SAHQPAEASQRSLQPYVSSLPSILSSVRKSYFREDHFKGGRSVEQFANAELNKKLETLHEYLGV